ncbi:MAG TPA: class I SAM-dependent methyltransferase [Candidatus Atribacteria bacterium]|nr:class I SAM-dependent methyltransferase [Candidatus Atribacteria bacterium]
MNLNDITVPKRSVELLRQSIYENYENVSKNIDFGVKNQFNITRAITRFKDLKHDIKIDNMTKKKILELGSGSGLFTLYLRKKSVEIYGIEPDLNSYIASRLLLKENNISNCIFRAKGESLPFKENTFDIIVSYQVLEHTKDPFSVLKESKRVLKKEGIIYFVVPNYFSFWEGHYGLLWFPFLNKFLAKCYVRVLGRNDKFIDDLHFINPFKIKKWCKELNLEIKSMGVEKWRFNLLESPIRDHWASSKLMFKLIKIVRVSKLGILFAYIGSFFNLYYPIYLIAKKR